MSPRGGYGKKKLERVAGGIRDGYEIINGGLALSGPQYCKRFHHVVMQLLDEDCISQFKFDGTGTVNSSTTFVPPSRIRSSAGVRSFHRTRLPIPRKRRKSASTQACQSRESGE